MARETHGSCWLMLWSNYRDMQYIPYTCNKGILEQSRAEVIQIHVGGNTDVSFLSFFLSLHTNKLHSDVGHVCNLFQSSNFKPQEHLEVTSSNLGHSLINYLSKIMTHRPSRPHCMIQWQWLHVETADNRYHNYVIFCQSKYYSRMT